MQIRQEPACGSTARLRLAFVPLFPLSSIQSTKNRRIDKLSLHRSRWAKMDSNHRRRKPADLQSAPFGHSGICPFCVCDGKGRHKSRKRQEFSRFCAVSRLKKAVFAPKHGQKRLETVFYYSKDWTNCTILTAVMANSRPLFIFSPARSSACCSSLTVSTPLITGTFPVALSRTSPSVVPRQM